MREIQLFRELKRELQILAGETDDQIMDFIIELIALDCPPDKVFKFISMLSLVNQGLSESSLATLHHKIVQVHHLSAI